MIGLLVLLGIWLVALNGDAVRRVMRLRPVEAEPETADESIIDEDMAHEDAADYEHAA